MNFVFAQYMKKQRFHFNSFFKKGNGNGGPFDIIIKQLFLSCNYYKSSFRNKNNNLSAPGFKQRNPIMIIIVRIVYFKTVLLS